MLFHTLLLPLLVVGVAIGAWLVVDCPNGMLVAAGDVGLRSDGDVVL